jgi:hypothetical protein
VSTAELRKELGDLDVLDDLSDEEGAELLGMIHDTRRTQNKALDAAINEVLRFLPRLIRGTARKIVFG